MNTSAPIVARGGRRRKGRVALVRSFGYYAHMRIIFVRHGHRRAGEADPALTSLGRRQARQTALWLEARGIVPKLLVHTPTARTRQTAEELALVFPAAALREVRSALEEPDAWDELVASFEGVEPVVVVGHHPQLHALLTTHGPAPLPIPRDAFAAALVLDSDGAGTWSISAAWPGGVA